MRFAMTLGTIALLAASAATTVRAAEASAPSKLRVMIETDAGDPPLTRYARVVLTVEPN
jgi:hypothetical protein